MDRYIAFITVALCLGAAAQWTDFSQGDNEDQGKSLYEQKCMICHGAGGKGDGPAAAALNKPPADFNKSEFWQGDAEKKITDAIRNGRSPMPAFDLSSEEIKAIIDYLEHAFKK
jgi:mono/diheme cytochrome c family protein